MECDIGTGWLGIGPRGLVVDEVVVEPNRTWTKHVRKREGIGRVDYLAVARALAALKNGRKTMGVPAIFEDFLHTRSAWMSGYIARAAAAARSSLAAGHMDHESRKHRVIHVAPWEGAEPEQSAQPAQAGIAVNKLVQEGKTHVCDGGVTEHLKVVSTTNFISMSLSNGAGHVVPKARTCRHFSLPRLDYDAYGTS